MDVEFKKKSGFIFRQASKLEINQLIKFLATQKIKNNTTTKGGLNKLVKNETKILKELINGKVLIQEFKAFKVSIYIFTHTQVSSDSENKITSMNCRVLQTRKGMEYIENDHIVFDLDELKKSSYIRNINKPVGRHKRPKDQSIIKSIKISAYINKHPKVNRDFICKEFGFNKTTYYRTLKWMENTNYKTINS